MKSPFEDNNIDDLFSRELKEYQTPAPKGVWNRINAQLPIKNNPFPLYIAASVFIAALLTVGWWGISSTQRHNTIATSANNVSVVKGLTSNKLKIVSNNSVSRPENITEQHVSAGNNNTIVNPLALSTVKQTNNSITASKIKSNRTSQLDSSNEQGVPVNLISEPAYQLQALPQLQNLSAKPIAGLLQPGLDNISYDDIGQPATTITPVTLNNRKIKGFYAGVNGTVNNVWILDHVALHDKNFNYRITPGFAYGVQAGYNFSDNFGLETGFTINARDGQSYTMYINSVIPVNKSVVLNYTEVPVLAKFKIPQISAFTGMPIVLNLNIGASYGYLRSSYTFVEGDKAGSQNQYPNNQINALAGFSYDIYTNHPYSFSFGFMGEYGINTTDNNNPGGGTSYTSTPTISRYANGSDFNRPHNLSLGINLAMNYNFSLFHN